MIKNAEKIQYAQTLLKNEFDKPFKIKVDKDFYKVALTSEHIPTIKSYKKDGVSFVLYFTDEPNEKIQNISNEVTNKIFDIREDLNGKLYSASIAYHHLASKNFGKIRSEVEPLYKLVSDSPEIIIKNEKKIKLLHVALEIMKKMASSFTEETPHAIECVTYIK